MICSKLLWLRPVNRKNKSEEEEKKTKGKRVHLWAILALNTKGLLYLQRFVAICSHLSKPEESPMVFFYSQDIFEVNKVSTLMKAEIPGM